MAIRNMVEESENLIQEEPDLLEEAEFETLSAITNAGSSKRSQEFPEWEQDAVSVELPQNWSLVNDDYPFVKVLNYYNPKTGNSDEYVMIQDKIVDNIFELPTEYWDDNDTDVGLDQLARLATGLGKSVKEAFPQRLKALNQREGK